MCDYSLTTVKTRPAKVGDKLMTYNFGTGTTGFTEVGSSEPIAVCLLPGTEIAFEKDVATAAAFASNWQTRTGHNDLGKVAVFDQIAKNDPRTHHDVVRFPDDRYAFLTSLFPGQHATVLQLPAAPKNDAEREHQRRAEFAR